MDILLFFGSRFETDQYDKTAVAFYATTVFAYIYFFIIPSNSLLLASIS